MQDGSHSPFVANMGGRLEEVRPGYARLVLVAGPSHLDPWGRVHRGVLGAIMDSAVGAALGHLKAMEGLAEAPQATVSMDVLFLATSGPGELVAEGKVLQWRRPVAFGEAQVGLRDGPALARASIVFLVGRGDGWRTST
ncbi:MAG TPA: PaaI family thioesterase [Dehalococcoidia bacterium]|nr:PaaI family thioesterase [Dehalococcoidia bacterium]